MPDRPDLSRVDDTVVAYIERLEAQLEELRSGRAISARAEPRVEPSEPPTTVNVIAIGADGSAKRTPRHLYTRQRRGGNGCL